MQAGFAAVDITPPETASGSVHDPLRAKAVVLGDERARVALVSVDAVALSTTTADAIRARASEATGIPRESMLVAATCTHSGGPTFSGYFADEAAFLRERVSDPLVLGALPTAGNAPYLAFLQERVVTAIAAADSRREAAGCGVGSGQQAGVAFNRRFRMRNGVTWTHPGKSNPDIVAPAGPTDPEVGVLSVWAKDGELLGCVVNFACYATTNPAPGLYSADWPCFLEQTIQAVFGKQAVILFLIGACGDVTQVDNQSLQAAEYGEPWSRRLGRAVGAEALKVLSGVGADFRPSPLAPLRAAVRRLELPYREVAPERLAAARTVLASSSPSGDYRRIFASHAVLLHAMRALRPALPVEVQAVQIGPLAIVSSPGFLFCQFGLDLKAASSFPHTFVSTFANGDIGYVCTDDAYGPGGGGYEPRNAKVGSGAGALIGAAWRELLQAWTPGELPERPRLDPWPAAGLAPGDPSPQAPWNYGAVGPDDL